MLTDDEIFQIKYELGYNTLTVGAEPYVTFVALFNQVIQRYMSGRGETIVRDLLGKIQGIRDLMDVTSGTGSSAQTATIGSIKKADDVEFYPSASTDASGRITAAGGAQFQMLSGQIEYWQRELSATLGVQYAKDYRRAAGARASVY